MSRKHLLKGLALFGLCIAIFPAGIWAQRSSEDLSGQSLEQLTRMQVRVSSFARKAEDLWTTPAAVFVITKEDIERSSLSSIPELLRLVPGMQVAQIDASSWAVSARGFNSLFADKLLVLVDGRTVYSETFSGTPWDQIDLPVQDIERIEVILGPGAAVWGTNAVNGVINIITKRTRSTLGLRLSGNLGRVKGASDIRYGAALGQMAQYRAFASYVHRAPFDTTDGKPAFDGENIIRGGGRLDWQQSPTNWITTSGELYGGHQEQQVEPSVSLNVGAGDREHESLAGGHVVSLWEHTAKRGETALQLFYDDQSRHELATYFRSRTLDLDYQDHLPLGPRHDLVWGAELRFTGDSVRAIVPVTTLPHYKNELADVFAQDEIVLLPQKLVLTLGSKIQVGTLAGFQIQPSARILWAPKETQSLWAAVSRAAVAPSVQDKDINFPLYGETENGLPVFAQLVGDPHFRAETVLAYEVGYRRRVGSKLTVDVATFLNRYDRMQSLLSGAPYLVPTPSPHIELQRSYTNGYRANSGGVEATLSWKPIPSFSFQGSYAWMQSHATQTEVGQITLVDSWSSPHNTVSGSASWTFIPQWTANSFVSYVTTLPPVYVASNSAGSVSAYTRLDANLGRMLGKSFEFKVGGTNLLSPRHFEFGGETGFVVPSEARRSLFLNVSWTF